MSDKVSIIIPLYNYEQYISDCLLSCIKQSHKNLEIIVIDDKSMDHSVFVVREFIKRYKDDRIKLICLSENKGYSHAKNVGILDSQSRYIVHLDADDMLTKKSIEVRLNYLNDHPDIMMVHGIGLDFHGNENYDWCCENESNLVPTNATIHAQGVMLRKEAYELYGLYDENLRSKADKEMWIRLRDFSKINIEKINIPVAYYRKHGGSMMAYRRSDIDYEKSVIDNFNAAIEERKNNGITAKNTRLIMDS